MAIVLTKQPIFSPLTAYNNNIIEYYADLSGSKVSVTNSKVTVNGIEFMIYPDLNGSFFFDLKEVAMSLINQDNFSDDLNPNASDYILKDDNLFIDLNVSLDVILTNGTIQSRNLTYPTIKGTRQIIKDSYENDKLKLISPKAQQTTELTYFDGYPFDVSFYQFANVNLYYKKGNTDKLLQLTEKGVNRIFISEAETELEIENGLNEMNFYFFVSQGVKEEFNINLIKEPYRCGRYVKWLNPAGGWSYFLFDELRSYSLRTKTLDRVARNFNNIGDTNSNMSITGKEALAKMTLKAENLTRAQRNVVETVLLSPKVYFYVNDDFAEVEVDNTTIRDSNKYDLTNFEFDIILPEIYTQTL